MAWDLRSALLRKAETETARLDAFDFDLRARTLARLVEQLDLGLDREAQARMIAGSGDEGLLDALRGAAPQLQAETLRRAFEAARAEARARLIAERGDPAPHRLA